MQVDYVYAKDTDKPKSQSVHVTVSLKGTELLSIHVFFVMMIYTLIITNHIYIYTYIICWFSWLIFCSCQPNHHPIFAGQGGVSFRLESSGRCSVWMQSSAFLEITVFVLVMMLKCKCYIYIYIQHVPFFNGNWETFQYLWGKFSRSKLWTQMFFSSGSFMHVWKKRCKLAWFLWSPFLGISIKQPTSSLVNSKRQGDDFAMRKWVTKAAPIDFYKMMSFFGVRSVVFFFLCQDCFTKLTDTQGMLDLEAAPQFFDQAAWIV